VIRFRDENGKQWRIFGFASPDNHCFVMVIHGYEKDRKYFPPDYLERVGRRKGEIGQLVVDLTVPWPG
jgi:hypothetical protein